MTEIRSGRHLRLQVPDTEAGLRLDQFLAARGAVASRGEARRVIDIGGVHVAGRRVSQCSRLLASGEVVEFYTDGAPLEPFTLSSGLILFRDPYLLAIDKPAGIETQPTPARYKGTLYAATLNWLQNPHRPYDKPELGMVQRLDRETSGVLIFSTHKRAHRPLTTAFSGRQVRKVYYALVSGRPAAEQGEISSQLARGRDNRMRSVQRGGREALTRYRVLVAGNDASLLEIEILTGRSHQIRVHLSESGHPLLGDKRYGGVLWLDGDPVQRHMLHCRRLELPHPLSGDKLIVEAPIPGDFCHTLRRAGLSLDTVSAIDKEPAC